MNGLFRQKVLCCFLVVPFCALSNLVAQTTMTTSHAADCSNDAGCVEPQVAVRIQGAHPFGPAQVGIISTGGAVFGLQDLAEVVKGQPYQAQAVTEMRQTLADGSHIVQTTTATVARDSDGRTVRVQKLSAIGPWKSSSSSSQGNGVTLTSVFDPVAKTHIDYTSDTKVAHVMPMPPPLPSPPSGAVTTMASGFAVSTAPTGPGMNVMYSVPGRTDSPDTSNNSTSESLGTKSIDGIQATGTRKTDTIPAGSIGNDKDIIVTRETWYSPDLKVVIQSTQDDPRFGQSTYSLSNIQQNEPDETLFQVPMGYKIEKPRVFVNTHPQ
jgi:hypothetical protein